VLKCVVCILKTLGSKLGMRLPFSLFLVFFSEPVQKLCKTNPDGGPLSYSVARSDDYRVKVMVN
jgi:hypothetical protein